MIAQASQAILDRAKQFLGNKVANYEILPTSVDPDAQLNGCLHKTPAVFVAFLGGPAIEGDTTRIDAEFSVLVLTDSPSEAHRRATATPILELLVPALDHWLVPGVGTLKLEEVSNLCSDTLDAKGLTLFGVTYRVPLPMPLPEDPASSLTPFETFHADWTPVPPDAPPTDPLPLPAGEAKASDHVHLQGDQS